MICKEMHDLGECPKFVALKPDEQASFVIEKKQCRNCLKSGHELDKCWSNVRCSSCQGDHHSLLHVKVPTAEDMGCVLTETVIMLFYHDKLLR